MKCSRVIGAWLLAALLVAGVAMGCMVGPNYRRPVERMPEAFHEVAAATAPSTRTSTAVGGVGASERWWMTFRDPVLNALIAEAVRGNRDLRMALSRVRQARAQRGVVAARLFPSVDATSGYIKSRGSQNVVLPLGGASGSSGGGSSSGVARETGGSGGGNEAVSGLNSPLGAGGLPGVDTEIYQVGLDARWEIDIFGGNRRSVEAAYADIAAAEEELRDVRITLLAEVAVNYIELRAAQARLAIAQQNLASQREILQISRDRFQTGFSTQLDVSRQAAEVASTAATLPAFESLQRDAVHRLAFLIGADPSGLDAALVPAAGSPAAGLPMVPLEVPVGVPSDLLRRRPDVRRAERQLASATALVGAATADLFPKFSLTGTAGLDSSDLKHLANWQSRYYSIGPSISWPILDWGRIRSNIEVRNEIQEQALVTYQNTIAQALKDVEDALVHFQAEQARHAALAEAVEAARSSVQLARQQYEKGLVDQLSLLDAQRFLLGAQDSMTQSEGMIRTDLVSLYKSLGGGWEP